MATTQMQTLNTEHIEAIVHDAIDAGSIPRLLRARERVIETKRQIPGNNPARNVLFGFITQINAKMKKLNEGKARYLLSTLTRLFVIVQNELKAKHISTPHLMLEEGEIPTIMEQLAREKRPFMVSAIEAVSGKPFGIVCLDFENTFANASTELAALLRQEEERRVAEEAAEKQRHEQFVRDAIAERNFAPKTLKRAKDLRGRFWANMETKNVSAAATVLWQLRDTDLVAPLLSLFGSEHEVACFFRNADTSLHNLRNDLAAKKRK